MTDGRFVPVLRVFAARLAEEDDDDQPRHVERGQESGEERRGRKIGGFFS